MTYECLLYEVKDGIATLTLNRPDRLNALGGTLRQDLFDAVTRAAADPDVRVMVVTGAGKGFCSGGDVKAMGEAKAGQRERPLIEKIAPGRDRTLLAMREAPQPIIAAVNGAAAGAGMNLALGCDIRIASTAARFTQAFVKRGLHPDWGGTYFLPRVVGMAKACEMIFTGDIIDAAEALRLGIVSRVVAPEELLPTAYDLARRIAAGPAGGDPSRQAVTLRERGPRSARRTPDRDHGPEHLLRDGGRDGRHPGLRREARAGLQGTRDPGPKGIVLTGPRLAVLLGCCIALAATRPIVGPALARGEARFARPGWFWFRGAGLS